MRKNRHDKLEDGVFTESVRRILDAFEDKDFLAGPGQYIKVNDSYILPKYQDVIYAQTDKIPAVPVINDQISYLNQNSNDKVTDAVDGIFFIVPISSIVALPQGYHSNRMILHGSEKLDYALSVTIVNGFINVGKDNDGRAIFSAICVAVLGYRSINLKIENKNDAYTQCVEYLNDFITAYKLFRHDHTVLNVTTRTLPSNIEFYTYTKKIISKRDYFTVNGNALADLWAKRLPHPDQLKNIETLTELLPTQKTVHYILRLGEEAISNICMGQYEDAIINSDRFAELVLRDVLRKELNLTPEELSDYRDLYSTRYPRKAVIQVLADRLNIKGDALISKWYKKSRIIRNNITHKLELESVDVEVALSAVEHNMRLIDLVINKSDKDFSWYQLIPDTYYSLFLNKEDSLDSIMKRVKDSNLKIASYDLFKKSAES